MSGLKYTPERAKQAAEEYAHPKSKSISSFSGSNGCAWYGLMFLLVSFIFSLVLTFGGNFFDSKPNKDPFEAEKAAMLNYACDEIYTFSYDDLENLKFNKKAIIEINQKEYSFNMSVIGYPPSHNDNIKEGIEYKKLFVVVIEESNKRESQLFYAAIPNIDGSFTLEKMPDFIKRMHK